MASLLLRCGCQIPFDIKGSEPKCPQHGRQSVVRTIGMPKPRIRGVATGPLVQTVDLTPSFGRFAGSEPTTNG